MNKALETLTLAPDQVRTLQDLCPAYMSFNAFIEDCLHIAIEENLKAIAANIIEEATR